MAALAVVFVGLGAAPAFGASGPQTASPAPVTNYAGYPTGVIPASCTAQGAAMLTGVAYSLNGGAPVADLAALGPVPNTGKITMTWTGFAAGCENIGVSLSRKIALSPAFQLADDQYLNVWSYCGPGGAACVPATGLTLDLSASEPVACYQLDANAGPPLRVVGPSGSYYSNASRGDQGHDMLISANNGGAAPCTPAPCANPTAPANMPAAAEACVPVTPTTVAPTTTAPPVATSAAAVTTTTTPTCATGQVRDATTGQCVAVLPVSAAALPFTGSHAADMARFGAAMVAAGLLFVGASRRWRTAPVR